MNFFFQFDSDDKNLEMLKGHLWKSEHKVSQNFGNVPIYFFSSFDIS